MNGWADERINETTGLHPVLGYFAPSGLGGLIFGAEVWVRKQKNRAFVADFSRVFFYINGYGSVDNLSTNPRKFVHSWLPFLTRF